MKVQHQIELLYFQLDEDLVCMYMISTFHYLIIIYQTFNVKISWKFWKTNQFKYIFFILFSYIKIPQTLWTTYNKLNEVFYDFKMQFK
jgi:hypothetical protein